MGELLRPNEYVSPGDFGVSSCIMYGSDVLLASICFQLSSIVNATVDVRTMVFVSFHQKIYSSNVV